MAFVGNKTVVGNLLFELRSWARYLLPTKYVAVYYPTPQAIIQRMLILAHVTESDTVYDLGCGDGRVLITAAQLYKARGLGVELDPELVAAALENVKENKVEHLVQIVRRDAHGLDVSKATVIALYLSDRGNKKLLASVQHTLRPSTRVVSFFFPVEGWDKNLATKDVTDNLPIFLYHAPDK